MIGFLVVDKPAGITSHDVVAAVRAVTGVGKVGHTGTLDPFATGVLPLALGHATRLIPFLDESIKVYDATILLGSATDTGDPTGTVVREAPVPTLDAATVERVLDGFLGESDQTPPAYSAVKVAGKPMYHYARKGIPVEAKARRISIHELVLRELHEDRLRVEITCSRGTYARVLADDIAVALGSAGHLVALARLRSGPFRIGEAVDIHTISGLVAAEPGHGWREVLLARRGDARVPWRPRDEVRADLDRHVLKPLHALDHLPLADVRASDAKRVRSGGAVPPAPSGTPVGGHYLVACGDELVAIADNHERGPRIVRVVPSDGD